MTTIALTVQEQTKEEFNPQVGHFVVAEDGLTFIVSYVSYKEIKLIDITDGSRWSDSSLPEALKDLEESHGKLRIAKKVSVNVEF